MLEQLRDFPVEFAEPATELESIIPAVQPAAPAQPESRRFELPGTVWGAMFACYAVFFAAVTVATGGSGHALFAIAISVLYAAMFFGTALVLARQGAAQPSSPLDRAQALPTWTGPMSARAVYGQVLVVPASIALFGVAISVICAAVL